MKDGSEEKQTLSNDPDLIVDWWSLGEDFFIVGKNGRKRWVNTR